MIELSDDQKIALKALLNWYYSISKKQFITLGGYAGTGKTTLISFLRQELAKSNDKLKVGFCSYTGKATQVLKRKLQEHKAVYKNDVIGTIHSLIYKAIEDERGVILGWDLRENEEVAYDLLIVDEASMLDQVIWNDLLSYNIPIIAVGDHGQLPPINGTFNLMEKPELKLEQIHRQARLNPIIKLSILAREQGIIPEGNYGNCVEKVGFVDGSYLVQGIFENYNQDTLLLCGYNSTRMRINAAVRNALGFEIPEPCPGDRVICLRNNREKQIFNGMLGTILEIRKKDKDKYQVKIAMDGVNTAQSYEGVISVEQFSSPKTLNNIRGIIRTQKIDLFDFGYALTVHKAQGSQARKIVLFEERFKAQDDEMWRRWLYTGVTRAEEELLIIG